MFNRAFGGIGLTLLVIVTLLVSFTNTFKFIVEFLPADPFWLRFCGFIFFEGGMLLWAHLFKHTTDNVLRTLIAGLMTVLSLSAVLTAMFYEIGKDVSSLGFSPSPAFLSWTPLCILAVIACQVVALLLYHFSDPHFFARMRYLNEHNRTPKSRPVFVQNVAHVERIESPQKDNFLSRLGAAWGAIARQPEDRSLIAQKSRANTPSNDVLQGDELDDEEGEEWEDEEDNEGYYGEGLAAAEAEAKEVPDYSYHTAASTRKRAAVAVGNRKRAKYRTYEQSLPALRLFAQNNPDITDQDLSEKVGCSLKSVRRFRREG